MKTFFTQQTKTLMKYTYFLIISLCLPVFMHTMNESFQLKEKSAESTNLYAEIPNKNQGSTAHSNFKKARNNLEQLGHHGVINDMSQSHQSKPQIQFPLNLTSTHTQPKTYAANQPQVIIEQPTITHNSPTLEEQLTTPQRNDEFEIMQKERDYYQGVAIVAGMTTTLALGFIFYEKVILNNYKK